jgi:hypothetical protein
MGRPWVTHSKIGNPWDPMGTHWVNCKYLFSSQMLSDKKHIIGKLIYFYIESCKELSNIEDVSRVIGGFPINPQLKCFEIFLIFHGLLLRKFSNKFSKSTVNRSGFAQGGVKLHRA